MLRLVVERLKSFLSVSPCYYCKNVKIKKWVGDAEVKEMDSKCHLSYVNFAFLICHL